MYTELFRRRIPSCIFPIQLTKFSSNVTLNSLEIVKHYCHIKGRGKLNMAIMVISQIMVFCHPQLNRWNVGQANYIQPLCLIVICLNSTLPTLICNSKWSLYVQTSGRNDIEDRRGRFWGQNVLNKVNPRILVLLCTVQIWNISNWVFLTEARSSLNNIIMVITESDILWRLKVNPEVFLLQQIPTLWWALWKCTRDVSPFS